MKKIMVTVAASAMMLATAAPAFSQDAVADDGSFAATDFDAGFYDASQSQDVDVTQTNSGDVTATADDDSTADAYIDQGLYIEQDQYNGGFDDGYYGDPFDDTGFFDDDFDGILDEYDYVILFGDYDNDGVVDDFEF